MPRVVLEGRWSQRLTALECLAFHFHIDFNILAGRRDADMSEPCTDDIEFNPSLEEVHSRCVAKGMRANLFSLQRSLFLGLFSAKNPSAEISG